MDIKDKIVYRKKYNDAKNELEFAKQSFAESLKRVGEVIIEQQQEIDYYKELCASRYRQIKKLKEVIKNGKQNTRK